MSDATENWKGYLVNDDEASQPKSREASPGRVREVIDRRGGRPPFHRMDSKRSLRFAAEAHEPNTHRDGRPVLLRMDSKRELDYRQPMITDPQSKMLSSLPGYAVLHGLHLSKSKQLSPEEEKWKRVLERTDSNTSASPSGSSTHNAMLVDEPRNASVGLRASDAMKIEGGPAPNPVPNLLEGEGDFAQPIPQIGASLTGPSTADASMASEPTEQPAPTRRRKRGRKRKQNPSSEPRKTKKRAKVGSTCLMCHKRKVKCERKEPGAPCDRCTKAGEECKVASKKGWKENRAERARRRAEAEIQTGGSGNGRSFSNLASTNLYGKMCNVPGCNLKKFHGGKHVSRW